MSDSGDPSRLRDPPARSIAPTATPGSRRQPSGTIENPTWLTESAYAYPIADDAGPSRRGWQRGGRHWLRWLFLLLVLLVPFSVFAVGASVYWQARTAEPRDADAIVVMGAAQYNGRPSTVFRARLDHALDLYEEGFAPLVVLTGGKMPDDVYTEAETGAQYLIDRGVPASAIAWENEGRDTWESMQGVAAVLDGRAVDSLLIVSDGFHLLRSELMARELGFTAHGSATPGSPIQPWSANEFAYVVRETGGIFALAPRLLGFD